MNQEQTKTGDVKKMPISLSFDDFELNAESFKPVTKGLGFHQEQKKVSFKPSIQHKIEKTNPQAPLHNLLRTNENKIKNQAPSGLEAFYGVKPAPIQEKMLPEKETILSKPTKVFKDAAQSDQFIAWIIDIFLIASSVVLTGTLLVLVSGISFNVMIKLVTEQDLILFGSSLFGIYYILYFTILELSTTPGKIIMNLQLVNTDQGPLKIKHTFTRAFVSLLSLLVFCLPMVLDFQGRLSDTKIVK